ALDELELLDPDVAVAEVAFDRIARISGRLNERRTVGFRGERQILIAVNASTRVRRERRAGVLDRVDSKRVLVADRAARLLGIRGDLFIASFASAVEQCVRFLFDDRSGLPRCRKSRVVGFDDEPPGFSRSDATVLEGRDDLLLALIEPGPR